ncbi:MerR family transcriptional regulator [Collinsella intestinalis]|uniref:MerR family transcriptional regulator n=1 Tax=Collinsella intestinalis TaxID=147207 RepID=UPI001EF73793|nr:MerR family transcriptional regulator [Collinsella intestinalis]
MATETYGGPVDAPRIKDSYTISEISRLFGIGIDSLRYYERLGVLAPRRAPNGYRLYDLGDMYKLALIKDLRRLDVPLRDAKGYLDHQTVASTLELLDHEERLLDARIAELEADRAAIREHAAALSAATERPVGAIAIEHRTERRCVELAARIVRDEEMDLLIQRLHRQHENALPRLGALQIAGRFSVADLAEGRANVLEAVFFVLEDTRGAREHCDFILPEGDYLTLRYRGPYEQNAGVYRRLREHARAEGLSLTGVPCEFYEIDNRDTADPAEFVSRIEIAVAG